MDGLEKHLKMELVAVMGMGKERDSRWLGSWAGGGPGLELGLPGRSRFEPEDREFNSAHFIFVAPRGGRHPGKRLES